MAMENLTAFPNQGGNVYATSASSSTASSSAPTSRSHYDVFINHRGPDVKNTFASHLYRRLLDRGLSVFLDKEELEEGHNISSQIQQAISGASVHIAILSPTYADSSWCLKELVLMKNSQATILPIFFMVDPSVVRHPDKDGPYAKALQKLQEKRTSDPQTGEEKARYGSDTIQNWRATLSHVADLSGFELKKYSGDEGELLDAVLQSVLKNVSKRPLYVAQYPTGLDLKLEEFEKTVLQEQEEQVKPRVVGIVGIGGVGKTTLAKAFFNRKRSNYNESSFIANVREMSLNILKSTLIKGLKLGNIETQCLEEDIGMDPLSCHALIILDDVNDADQLEVLLSIKDMLSPESLVLVTSRDKHVLKSHGVSERSLYYLKGLNIQHSRQLFCSYALHRPDPLPEIADLVDQFVEACDGLPLSLKVVGALLYGQDDRSYWEEQLGRLQHTLPIKIEGSLRISYDSLNKEDRSIFLDIACFFIGEDREKAIRIWGKVGFQNLQDKCLLEVDSENKINMLDHIRDMGRQIAKEVSMPRRICHSTTNLTDDLFDLLQQSSPVITEVRGISMVSSSVDFFRDKHPDLSNTTNSHMSRIKSSEVSHLVHNFQFPGMRKLQLVKTEEGHLEDILMRVQPPHLLWLRWYRYSHSSLPDWIPMTKLKVLEMEGSSLTILWPHQSQMLPLDLRELNIRAPLSEIPRSIGQLKNLERIAICNHSKAITVERLPVEFCHLRSLKYLVFKGFSRMLSLPDSFGELAHLQHIDLEGAFSLLRLPNSFGDLTRLKYLSLRGCENLIISNGTLGDITTLEYLDLSCCRKVKSLPPQVARQQSLQNLYLQEMKIKELAGVECLTSLEWLSVSGCEKIRSIPGLGQFTNLKHLDVRGCREIQELARVECLTSLEWFSVSGCEKIRSIPGLEHFTNLKHLDVSGCREIQELAGVECLTSLEWFGVNGCEKLRSIPGLGQLTMLRNLYIKKCCKIRELPGLEHLTSLEILDIRGCRKLRFGAGVLEQLRHQLGDGLKYEKRRKVFSSCLRVSIEVCSNCLRSQCVIR